MKFDLVIPDIMGVRGFDLPQPAVVKRIPVVVAIAHRLNPESLRKSKDLGARALLPKDQPGHMAPFLEDVLTLSSRITGKPIFTKLGNSCGMRFLLDGRRSKEESRERTKRETELSRSTIVEP